MRQYFAENKRLTQESLMADFSQPTFQMRPPGAAGAAGGTWALPSGNTVSLTDGVASVEASDVPGALIQGCQMLVGQNWPGGRVYTLSAPPASSGASYGSTWTAPDGTVF